ncbi:MAG: hypothetical protein OXC95_06075 [Dehalococcoidia bacterium]|nr:hypothetical protein [Dehalococcoidia bacterium]
MTQPDVEYIRRAEWHLSMVASYRADASLLLERGSPHSAGTLLYESAKQCLNAVANKQGNNPVHTREKMRYLGDIVAQYPDRQPVLKDGWQAALDLHLHADRGNLADDAFESNWHDAQMFIDDILQFYEEEES